MKNIVLSIALLLSAGIYSQTLVIHFDFDKYGLTRRAKLLIDSFLSAERQKLPGASLQVEGHCDFFGSDAYNDQLSLKRVAGVKKLLETDYSDWAKNVNTAGYGEKKPLNENKTAAQRSLNRRVEITIVQSSQATTEIPKETPPEKKIDPSLKEQIADTAIKKGSSIALRNISFEGGRHVFLPEAYPALQELLDIMTSNPTLIIEIGGHICCQAGDGDAIDADLRTYTLSHERAKAVYSYLVSHGIKADRLSYKGYAHTQPIHPFPENTEEERIANRRVEIKIVSK